MMLTIRSLLPNLAPESHDVVIDNFARQRLVEKISSAFLYGWQFLSHG